MTLPDRARYPIHDLYIRHLDPVGFDGTSRLTLVRDADHLLRRFGQADLIRLPAGERLGPRVRAVADEVWVLESGQAVLCWRDDRPRSPTHGREHRLHAEQPVLVLVPFGVAFGVRCRSASVLVRFSTHEDLVHDGDHDDPWPEEW
jgi:mannose-6-phosphate isomerase-like protein (cupin superfamily)